MIRQIFAALLPLPFLLLCGCVNGFEKYYQGMPDGKLLPAYDASYPVPAVGTIPIYSSADVDADTQKLLSQGFVPIGESSFYGPENKVDRDQLQRQASAVGAHLVLFKSSYRDTISGTLPITVPNSSTSYSTGTATATGTNGSATAYGNAVTTTYGTSTAFVPYSQSRSNYLAVYFVKSRVRIGLYVSPLSDFERRNLQTNLAVKVTTVIQDSPAFFANIFPGDFLTAVNEDAITSRESWKAALDKYQGQDVVLHLLRDGKTLDKKIHINGFDAAVVPSSKMERTNLN